MVISPNNNYTRPQESAIEIEHLKGGELVILDTIWGHAAGSGASMEDTARIDGAIANFLRS